MRAARAAASGETRAAAGRLAVVATAGGSGGMAAPAARPVPARHRSPAAKAAAHRPGARRAGEAAGFKARAAQQAELATSIFRNVHGGALGHAGGRSTASLPPFSTAAATVADLADRKRRVRCGAAVRQTAIAAATSIEAMAAQPRSGRFQRSRTAMGIPPAADAARLPGSTLLAPLQAASFHAFDSGSDHAAQLRTGPAAAAADTQEAASPPEDRGRATPERAPTAVRLMAMLPRRSADGTGIRAGRPPTPVHYAVAEIHEAGGDARAPESPGEARVSGSRAQRAAPAPWAQSSAGDRSEGARADFNVQAGDATAARRRHPVDATRVSAETSFDSNHAAAAAASRSAPAVSSESRVFMGALRQLRAGLTSAQAAQAAEKREQLKRDLAAQVRCPPADAWRGSACSAGRGPRGEHFACERGSQHATADAADRERASLLPGSASRCGTAGASTVLNFRAQIEEKKQRERERHETSRRLDEVNAAAPCRMLPRACEARESAAHPATSAEDWVPPDARTVADPHAAQRDHRASDEDPATRQPERWRAHDDDMQLRPHEAERTGGADERAWRQRARHSEHIEHGAGRSAGGCGEPSPELGRVWDRADRAPGPDAGAPVDGRQVQHRGSSVPDLLEEVRQRQQVMSSQVAQQLDLLSEMGAEAAQSRRERDEARAQVAHVQVRRPAWRRCS